MLDGQSEEPERIGNYRVHPVASIFPPLPDDEYEDLKGSIELIGQTYPIIVQDDWLLDGRNRLRACLELEIAPKIQEYRGNEKPEFFIETVNMHRRHLDEGARATISAKIRAWIIGRQNAEAQKTGKSADGAAGGRGHKKAAAPPPPADDQSLFEGQSVEETLLRKHSKVSESQSRSRNARSTVGQVADAAKVSHHKAAQAMDVAKYAPELLDEVISGKMPLSEAAKKAQEQKPTKPRRKPKFKLDTAVGHAKRTMAKWITRCPSDSRDDFKTRLLKECRELCRM